MARAFGATFRPCKTHRFYHLLPKICPEVAVSTEFHGREDVFRGR